MKKVLFIGVTTYDLRSDDSHLAKKFEGLSCEFNVVSIARGVPFRARKWNADFFLIPYRPLFIPVAFLLGAYLCALGKIDAIVCQTPLTEGLVGVALKTFFRKELIVEVHGDWEELPFLSRKRMCAGLLKRVTPHVAALSLRRADKVRTLTKRFAAKIEEVAPGKKVLVFPTYTDIDYFLEGVKGAFKRYILTVAVLSPIKNIETLIDAFARVHKEFPDYRLVIAGEGPSRRSLEQAANRLSLANHVVFAGKLTPEQVREAMKDCYLFALPSLSEGFGRVFIEAMALGKPAVGSNVGGIPEVIRDGENGFLVEPKDAEGLARKMKSLLADERLAQSMGEAGRRFVRENFSNKNYVANFSKMIYE